MQKRGLLAWTDLLLSSREGVPSTLRMPSSSLRRDAASSKRALRRARNSFVFMRDGSGGCERGDD